MAEDAGSMLQPPLPQHGDQGPKGPEVEASAPHQSQEEGKSACASSRHSFGVRQVMDARIFNKMWQRPTKTKSLSVLGSRNHPSASVCKAVDETFDLTSAGGSNQKQGGPKGSGVQQELNA